MPDTAVASSPVRPIHVGRLDPAVASSSARSKSPLVSYPEGRTNLQLPPAARCRREQALLRQAAATIPAPRDCLLHLTSSSQVKSRQKVSTSNPPEPYLDPLFYGRFTSRLALLVGGVLARVYYLLDLKYPLPNHCPRFQQKIK